MRHSWARATALTVLACGCASVPKFTPDHVGRAAADRIANDPGTAVEYKLGPLDVISVSVWGRPDLGSQVPDRAGSSQRSSSVADDGTIVMPLIGRIPVAGLGLDEAARLIASRYAKLASNPQVEVQLLAARSRNVYVFGEVVRQGAHPIPQQGMSILDALAAAGGPEPMTAKTDALYLLRLPAEGEAKATVYQLELAEVLGRPDLRMAAGDRLFVPPNSLAKFERTWKQFVFVPLGIGVGLAGLALR